MSLDFMRGKTEAFEVWRRNSILKTTASKFLENPVQKAVLLFLDMSPVLFMVHEWVFLA